MAEGDEKFSVEDDARELDEDYDRAVQRDAAENEPTERGVSFLPKREQSGTDYGAIATAEIERRGGINTVKAEQAMAAFRSDSGKENAAAIERTNGPGETRYSVEETVDGRAVAVVDDDILSDIDTTSWDESKKRQAQKAAKNAMLKFKDGVQVNGINYKVNKTSRDEYTRSNEADKLFRKDPTVFADKLRAAAVTDDVITTSTSWAKDGGLKHPRKDNFVDFAHGIVLLQSEQNQYEAETIVGITDAGEYVFYDVNNINPTNFTIKKELPTAATDNNAESTMQGNSSKGSIAKDAKDVKQRFSVEDDSEYLPLAEKYRDGTASEEETEQLCQMVDEAAKAEMPNTKVVDSNGSLQKVFHGTNSREEKSRWNSNTKSFDTEYRQFYVFKKGICRK